MDVDTQNLILSQIPITFVTLLVDGMKDEINDTGEPEWIPFMIAKGTVVVGTPEYYIDKNWFNISEYLHLNWDEARIAKLEVNLDSDGVRSLINSKTVPIGVIQDIDTLCLIPSSYSFFSSEDEEIIYQLSPTSKKNRATINANIHLGSLEGQGVVIASGLIENSYGIECYQGFK